MAPRAHQRTLAVLALARWRRAPPTKNNQTQATKKTFTELNPDCRWDLAARAVLRQFAAKWAVAWEEGNGGGDYKQRRSDATLGVYTPRGQRPRRICRMMVSSLVMHDGKAGSSKG